ncbi:uncharacterized protein [Medicago truncatula]|uniref:uncharacterized protein n=1 Tax=Medicago truncatula TaxID=3880 RepID=UPI000D2F4146|nr:uncharacterized protein LOC112422105 [Medicago truncatula]
MNNRLRLKASIDVVCWLTLQACAFRGHDEKVISKNQGNFLELLKLLASYNDEVAQVVLNNAPKNGKYTCHQVQKELLEILSSRVKKHIREEIGDSKFCIIVDEARDESQKEQMALVLRFVDKDGLIQERFFDMRCVTSTTSLSLKEAVCDILSRHNLDVSNLRGQGYDGASNMRGEWNGLQALFMKDCPYAYYIHCFAHRLQLSLITASSERHDELQAAQLKENEYLLEIEGIVPGKGANQIGTVKRATDTRWGSHFSSIYAIEIPDLDDLHSATRFGRSRLEENQDSYKAFDVDTICTLVDKYYPMDFNDQGKIHLCYQLEQFIVDARKEPCLKNLSTIQELCSCLVATERNKIYFLIDRLLRLIMTLPVSTATTERSFSATKIIKTRLRNKMGSGFLNDTMTVYIEREISASISSESVIDDFKLVGSRNDLF